MKRLALSTVSARPSSLLHALSSDGAEPRIAPADSDNVADSLSQLLAECGVQHAFGITGGAVAPFCEALVRANIEVVHFRSETGAAFAAMEAYFANGHPVVVFATTGPGIINALNGIVASRWESGSINSAWIFSGRLARNAPLASNSRTKALSVSPLLRASSRRK